MTSSPQLNLNVSDGKATLLATSANSESVLIGEKCEQTILIRTLDAVSDPALLQIKTVETEPDGNSRIVFMDKSESWTAILELTRYTTGYRFQTQIAGPKPIWLAEWTLSGLDVESWIIPGLGGRVLTNEMPVGTRESYKHPFWWNAQFAIAEKSDTGFVLRSVDPDTNMKLLRIKKTGDHFDLSFGYEAKGPVTSTTIDFEWLLESYGGSWQAVADRHRNWLRSQHPMLQPKHPEQLRWLDDINFVLEIWGANRESETPGHSFAQMISKINEFAELHPPQQTLLYLVGFTNNGIDSEAPAYKPSEQCGGAKEFAQLVDRAHDLGYRVMIHTNVLAMTYTHPQYQRFKPFQVVDVFQRPQGWGMDIDGDWLAEPFFAYINPGFEAWGDLMEETLGTLVDEYRIDAIFLDQTLLSFNVHDGPDFLQGMASHVKRLQEKFPEILFAGEGIHDHISHTLSLAQIHGVDGIPGIHGSDEYRSWCQSHPVLAYTFSKDSKLAPHLLTRHPSHSDFDRQESIYSSLNIMPALCLYDHSQPIQGEATDQMLARAKKINREE